MKEQLSWRPGPDWIYGFILVLAIALAYQPIWHSGFIWDDDDHVTANPCLVGPLGLKEIWTTDAARYYPLVLTTFWLEHALWGLNPLLFHLVNALMMAACAIVLWRVLESLRIPGACFGAALWALHPVQVESVAWITELKNIQSGLFYLLSIFFFIKEIKARQGDGGDRWSYVLTLLFAALAMLSKSSTVVLPLVLCLCAWWMEGRWHWRNLARIAPVFLFAGAAAFMAVASVAQHGIVTQTQGARSLLARLVTAGDVFWFYLGKLIWPHPLIFIYPRWQIDATHVLSYVPLFAMLGVLFFLWRKRETWGRPWFFALAYFLVALLPVLGLVNHYFLIFSFVADHLQFLASMGPLALAGAGLSRWAEVFLPQKAALRVVLGAGVLATLGVVDWERAHVFKNDEILWSDTLAQNPASWMAHTNMATILMQRGQVDEAIGHYQQALKFNSDYAEGHYNLGLAYLKKGRTADAIAEYQKALALHPDFVLARVYLGLLLTQTGQPDEGMAQYEKALATNPNYGLAHYFIGLALTQKGHDDEAMVEFQQAVEGDPGLFDAHYSLGLGFLQKRKLDAAIEQFEKALSIKPAFAEVRDSLGLALLQKGQAPEAIAVLQQALQLEPGLVDAHYNLGNAYLTAKQPNDAATEFETVIKVSPNNADAHNNLAVALFESGRLNEAIVQFQEFVRLNPGDLHAKENLAKAQELRAHQKVTGGK